MKKIKFGLRTKTVVIGLSMILLGYVTSNSGLIVQGVLTTESAVSANQTVENAVSDEATK